MPAGPPSRPRPRPAGAGAPRSSTRPTGATPRRPANRLREVIEQYSPSLFEVFRHDPSLLLNDQYLASYPGLAAFLQQHPEVGHNPAYFVGEPQWEPQPRPADGDHRRLAATPSSTSRSSGRSCWPPWS